MQQRLLEIGKWLKVNGESIYGTRAFIMSKKAEQINPETNKTIFFTQKSNELFLICLGWPKGDIVLKDIGITDMAKAVLLGSDKAVVLKNQEKNLHILSPALNPDDHQLAYVFKITGLLKNIP
jgi:alpha-L-fucosidase